MPNRDSNGRFIGNQGKGLEITFSLPPFSRVILWGVILIIISPWIILVARLEILKIILSKFMMLFQFKEEENEPTKKNGLFG